MGVVLHCTFIIILSVEFIMGTLGNGFVTLVNILDWVKRRKLSAVDQILTALAISRIAMVWLVILDWYMSMIYPALRMTRNILRTVYISWTVINHFNLWLTACLSILYFLKIANFSNTIFLYLKHRVKKVILVTLLMSLFLLCLNIAVVKMYVDMHIERIQRNKSYTYNLKNYTQISKLLLFANPMFTFVPFAVSLVTILLLIFSLHKHLKSMQHSLKRCGDASTTAHIRALQTVVASVLLYTIFFLSLFVKVWSSQVKERYMIFLSVQALGMAVPSVHTFVLILGSSRLRWASLSVMWWLRCTFKTGEPKGP